MNMNPLLAQQLVQRFGRKAPLLTDKLYSMMSEQIAELPPEQYDVFVDNIKHNYDVAKNLLNQIGQINPASKRVATIHKLVEEEMAQAKKETTCRRGCSFCCHLNVDVTNDEGRVLRHLFEKIKTPEKIERLKVQAKLKDSYQHPYVLGKDAECVFLENSECSIYDQRPVSCRTHYSASEPKMCDTRMNAHEKISLFVSKKIEILKTVMYERYGCSPMAKQLLK